MYGEFDSDEAFARYREGAAVQRIREELLPLLERRPSFKHFQATIFAQG